MTDKETEEMERNRIQTIWLLILSGILIALAFSSCCPKYIPSTEVKRDTVVTVVHDTVKANIEGKDFGFWVSWPVDSNGSMFLDPNVTYRSDSVNPGAILTVKDHYIKVKTPADTVLIPTTVWDTVFTNDSTTTILKMEKYIPVGGWVAIWSGWAVALCMIALIVILFRNK